MYSIIYIDACGALVVVTTPNEWTANRIAADLDNRKCHNVRIWRGGKIYA